ncbi:MAG TPA: hypothetical protein VLY46_15535 [Usitatibacter sp.]|nr:hypothetical protein [Usitatibacter sp.]
MRAMVRGAAALACACWLPCAMAGGLSQPSDVDGVQATILEATRGEGDTVMVKWQLENTTAEKKKMTEERTGWYDPYRLSGDAYFLDMKNRTKYPVVRTPDRKPVAARYGSPNQYAVIPAKKKVLLWAKFNAPAADVKTVEVYLPRVSLPFEGVELR